MCIQCIGYCMCGAMYGAFARVFVGGAMYSALAIRVCVCVCVCVCMCGRVVYSTLAISLYVCVEGCVQCIGYKPIRVWGGVVVYSALAI